MIWDWFKTRRRLEVEREWALVAYENLALMIRTEDDIEVLREEIEREEPESPTILPGSDLGEGYLRLSHWCAKVFGKAAQEMLDGVSAPNYLTLTVSDPQGRKFYDITFQRKDPGVETPTEKATRLQAELDAIRPPKGRL